VSRLRSVLKTSDVEASMTEAEYQRLRWRSIALTNAQLVSAGLAVVNLFRGDFASVVVLVGVCWVLGWFKPRWDV
jgi:hypothetical protein